MNTKIKLLQSTDRKRKNTIPRDNTGISYDNGIVLKIRYKVVYSKCCS